MYADDDDIDIKSLAGSSSDSTSKRKQRALLQKLKEQGIDAKQAEQQTAAAGKLKLSVLKNQFAGKQDAEQKRDQENKEKAGSSQGTKTREQELKSQTMTADAKPGPGAMIDQGKRQDAANKAQEEQGEQGGEDA